MGLQNGRAGPRNFSPLPTGIARGAHLCQTTVRSRPLSCLWQGTLSSGLPGAIDVENFPELVCAISQPTRLLLKISSPFQQIVEKERT
jgi:hypothetical protein